MAQIKKKCMQLDCKRISAFGHFVSRCFNCPDCDLVLTELTEEHIKDEFKCRVGQW